MTKFLIPIGNTHGKDYSYMKEWFWDMVESLDDCEIKKLLSFWSGSPLPPLSMLEGHGSSSSSSSTLYMVGLSFYYYY